MLLVPRQRVPQAVHQRPQQLPYGLDVVELRQVASPEALDHGDGRCPQRGGGDVAEEAGPHLVELHRAAMCREQRADPPFLAPVFASWPR